MVGKPQANPFQRCAGGERRTPGSTRCFAPFSFWKRVFALRAARQQIRNQRRIALRGGASGGAFGGGADSGVALACPIRVRIGGAGAGWPGAVPGGAGEGWRLGVGAWGAMPRFANEFDGWMWLERDQKPNHWRGSLGGAGRCWGGVGGCLAVWGGSGWCGAVWEACAGRLGRGWNQTASFELHLKRACSTRAFGLQLDRQSWRLAGSAFGGSGRAQRACGG